MRVLLVEPDPGRARELSLLLREQNVSVDLATTAADTSAMIAVNKYTVIVLDEDLQSTTASAWVQHYRESNHGTPVIIITDNGDPLAKVALLDIGADEIIVRDRVAVTLGAYIRALARRCQPGQSGVLEFEDLSLDLRSWQVVRRGQPIPCTSREIAVLEFFLRNRQRVISRTELTESVWDGESVPDSNVIEVFIARLRRKIDKPFDVPLIHTIVGRGYMLSVTKPGTQSTA